MNPFEDSFQKKSYNLVKNANAYLRGNAWKFSLVTYDFLEPNVLAHSGDQILGRWGHVDQESKSILGCIMSSRPVYTTWDYPPPKKSKEFLFFFKENGKSSTWMGHICMEVISSLCTQAGNNVMPCVWVSVRQEVGLELALRSSLGVSLFLRRWLADIPVKTSRSISPAQLDPCALFPFLFIPW